MIRCQRRLSTTTADGSSKFPALARRVVDRKENDGIVLAIVIEKILAVLSPQIKDRLLR